MNYDQKEELRNKIEKDIAECRDNVNRMQASSSPVAPDNAVGRLSRMGSIVDKGVSDAMLQQNKGKLIMLEVSLKNIDKKDFGKCGLCGCSIPIERLMIIPECNCCVKCADK